MGDFRELKVLQKVRDIGNIETIATGRGAYIWKRGLKNIKLRHNVSQVGLRQRYTHR